jgi:4-hydroxybenzoate polyprenyltransferase
MNFRKISGFLKLEHSLFSLPLLFAGAALALKEQGQPVWALGWVRTFWIVLAGTGARTCALALNRLLDRSLDARNLRTKGRELPAGKMSVLQGWTIAAAGLAVYLWAAAQLGAACLAFSPLPIAIFTLYPLMKRFTFLAHAGVGSGLALAPLGGYVAVANRFPDRPEVWFLGGFTFCWVAGFDVLYALQDEAFDRSEGLHSIPSTFGPKASRATSAVLHLTALALLVALGQSVFHSSLISMLSLLPTAVLLGAEHQLGSSLEPNAAFFKVNAWIGFCVLFFVLVAVR